MATPAQQQRHDPAPQQGRGLAPQQGRGPEPQQGHRPEPQQAHDPAPQHGHDPEPQGALASVQAGGNGVPAVRPPGRRSRWRRRGWLAAVGSAVAAGSGLLFYVQPWS